MNPETHMYKKFTTENLESTYVYKIHFFYSLKHIHTHAVHTLTRTHTVHTYTHTSDPINTTFNEQHQQISFPLVYENKRLNTSL